jgi:prepilin-type N-terminal cleavage/methylation domain-containing protein
MSLGLRRNLRSDNRGFTIVELMIATAVLSVMLLLVSVILSSIGNLYFKETNQSRIQDAARNVTGEISQDLELNGGQVTTGAGAYCIDGTIRYSYVIGKQLGSATKHVLWRDTNPTPATCNAANLNLSQPSATGVELVPANARLSDFTITTTSPYNISINIAYGDDDLLCTPSVASTCTSATNTMTAADYQKGDLICKGHAGNSYCATANLSTVVVQRITGS